MNKEEYAITYPEDYTPELDGNGRYKIDLERPHKLYNMDFFRQAALCHERTGKYTEITFNPHPEGDYKRFWDEEQRRCRDGLVRDDGEWISGYNYFYWNYAPIWLTEDKEEQLNDSQNRRSERTYKFAKVWDSDYQFFHYIEQAEQYGQHACVLKTRGRGYSYKASSMLARNFFHFPGSNSFAFAFEKEFLIKDGLLSKAWDTLDWVDKTTPWSKLRQKVDREMHKKASYIESKTGNEKGYKSEIMGVSLKDDPNKARGKRAKLILWEEMGKFPGLLHAWNVALPSVGQGRSTFGLMVAFGTGGCLTAGNKVWDNKGNLINIEDVTSDTGIVGFKNGFNKEPVTWLQPPSLKQCVLITTNTGRTLECSTDHPIYKGVQKYGTNISGNEFVEACTLNKGDLIGTIESVNIWTTKKLEHARTIGMVIGDGTYGDNQSTRFSNADEELFEYLEKKFDLKKLRSHVTKDGRIYKEVRIKGFNKYLRNCGIYGQTKTNKRLPDNIHGYSRETVCELIGGLFDTDGYISIRDNKSRLDKKICEASIAQSSLELIKELQLLLQKLGIHSNIRIRQPRKNNPKDKNPWYELAIRDGRSLKIFSEEIKLLIVKKQDRLNQINKYVKTINFNGSSHKGLRYEKIISVENTGVKPVYNLTAGDSNTYIGNGIITHNTEGANFAGAQELFYNPEGYNIRPVKNMWELGRESTTCGWFVPEYYNREGCYDDDGNSDIKKALEEVYIDRKNRIDNTSDPFAIVIEKAERPCNPDEAIMRTEGTVFPVHKLKEQLATIESEPAKWIDTIDVGKVVPKDGNMTWEYTEEQPVRQFPMKDNKFKQGAIEIFEHPQEYSKGGIPFGLYIAGCDPYDDDESLTNSLGSVFILNTLTDRIVAEYTGRPDTAKEFYEKVWRLCKYYNAILNYENNKKGLYAYFEQKNALYMLADNPKILKDMEMQKSFGGGNKAKGTNATLQVNRWARELIKTYLIQPAYNKEDEENYQVLRSIAALNEMILWNNDGNFDRVSALGMLMILREDRWRHKASEMVVKVKQISDDPFFSRHIEPDPLTYFSYNNLIKRIN